MLNINDILEMHDLIIAASGGASGLRDKGQLESALGRINQTVFGEPVFDSIFDKAGAILESIALHHPFIDGNKRTAIAAAGLFLNRLGVSLEINDQQYEKFILKVVSDHLSATDIAKWLKQHSIKIKGK